MSSQIQGALIPTFWAGTAISGIVMNIAAAVGYAIFPN